MLSKIKEAAASAAAKHATQEHRLTNNSSNNNNNNTNNTEPSSPTTSTASESNDEVPSGEMNEQESDTNNNSQSKSLENELDDEQPQHKLMTRSNSAQNSGKRNQEELIDIVEISRKRRLSKESADSLTNFIRHSFLDHQQQLLRRSAVGQEKQAVVVEPNNNSIGDQDDRRQQHWAALNLVNSVQQRASTRSMASSSDLLALTGANRSATTTATNKRARMHNYSPEAKLFHSSQDSGLQRVGSKNSSFLGNVVERLHNQQQQQRRHVSEPEPAAEQSNSGISFHLQQFLAAQQPALDDNQHLVLAAAIHRALAEQQRANGSTQGTGSSTAAAAAAMSALNQQQHQQRRLVQQQQRHAQAAAALSALASAAGSQQQNVTAGQQAACFNGASNTDHHQRHFHHHSPLSVNQRAALAVGALGSAGQNTAAQLVGGLAPGAVAGNPLVDFKCDTCGSSFDDRHRLMQHQSIHLELKKDWFNETPVDEVMKIFNRRRGEFLCNLCNLRFEATLDFDQHNHQVHGPRPYCCQFCGNGTRTFKCWRQYLNHLYDHRYIFSCTIGDCDFTVNRRDSLRFHIFRFHLNCQLPTQQNRKSTSSASSHSPSSSPTSSSFSSTTNGTSMVNNLTNQLQAQQQQAAAAAAAAAAAFNLNFNNPENLTQFSEHFRPSSILQQQQAAAAKWHHQTSSLAALKTRLQQQQAAAAAAFRDAGEHDDVHATGLDVEDDDTDNEMNVAD